MKRKVTLHDIARKLNLSATTISLVMRDHPRISVETKERVRQTLREMMYEPDHVARALVTGKSNLVGVIVPNSNDPYYSEVFRGIEEAARAANYHVLLSSGSYDLEGYADRVKDMLGLRVGGLIAAPPVMSEKPNLPAFWRDLQGRGFHVVLVNRQLNPPIFHQVAADYTSGVRMVVETLASLGHRRVAYISGEPALLPIRQRLTAFRRFAKKQGFESEEALFERGPLSAAGGYEACRRLWTSIKRKPSAIVAFSDTVAVGALRFLHEQNLHIPADVSVIGFDGIAIGNFTCVSLSTISTPMYEIGKQAFELLVSSMYKNSGLPQSMILPVRLVLRESVGPAPASGKS